MKQIAAFALALVVFGAVVVPAAAESSAVERDGVFIHVTHGADDPHRVLMAFQMAVIMAEERDVAMYFDIKGVNVLLNDAPDLTYAHFPSLKTQLKKLRKKRVLMMACPGCLKAYNKSEDDLVEGVVIADKAKFFSFTKGRILTLDY